MLALKSPAQVQIQMGAPCCLTLGKLLHLSGASGAYSKNSTTAPITNDIIVANAYRTHSGRANRGPKNICIHPFSLDNHLLKEVLNCSHFINPSGTRSDLLLATEGSSLLLKVKWG